MDTYLIMASTSTIADSRIPIAEKISSSFAGKKPYPIVSQEIKDLTVDQAYDIQDEFVKINEDKGDFVIGYKAGLTSEPAQKEFGVRDAVCGTLFKSMLQWPGTLYKKNFSHMFIEAEIGFKLRKDITKPIQEIKALKNAVDIVFPAVELPDIAYIDMEMIKGTDLIATNVAARRVLIGNEMTLTKWDLNEVKVKLFHNSKEIDNGAGKNTLGDQWEALKWIVNNVLLRGGKVNSGYIIITGSLTKPIPANPGRYMADYGEFGAIEFEYK